VLRLLVCGSLGQYVTRACVGYSMYSYPSKSFIFIRSFVLKSDILSMIETDCDHLRCPKLQRLM